VKILSKGLSKTNNSLRVEDYKKTLFDKSTHSGTNRGFMLKGHCMHTYSAKRTGLSFSYVKRRVLDDGVSTINLKV
jgi:hypothetical protein